MLGLRYLVHRGDPPPGTRPLVAAPDYYVTENPSALPRVFVPSRVERIADDAERLRRLTSPSFAPRELALVESPEAPVFDEVTGEARLLIDEEERLVIAADMRTDGLVVIADLWDPGWKAFVDTRQRPVLRVNHALRGVAIGKGSSQLELRYEPASFARGVTAGLAALSAAGAWALATARARRGAAAGAS
jgi:hypothetical protein